MKTRKQKHLMIPAATALSSSLIDPASHRTALDAICRTDFSSFIQRCFYSLTPGSQFLMNWHILALAYYHEQVWLGKIKLLIINMPPRSLKSIVSSVAFPAFVLGHDPTKRVIAVSYGSDLATKHANDCRSILNSDWYRRLFPSTRISPTKNTESEVATTRNGYRLATSLDGTLTGRGGDIIIIDDPLKPIDALSDPKRERVNQWFFNTLLSRLDDKQHGAIIVVMQRLHMNDLSGVLLSGSDKWTHLNLTAIAECDEEIEIGEETAYFRPAGEVLHPAREPMSVLESIRSQLGSDTFAAQYQQAPVPPGGAMIKRVWIHRYDQLPARDTYSHIVQSWDTASKEGGQNDWSVCTTWLVQQNKYYLIDLIRGRFDYPTLRSRVIAHAKVHKPHRILIEDAGVGTAIIQELKNAHFSAIPVKPERDKVTRMSVQTGKFESGQVLFPKQAPWLAELEAELFAFPQARHDDQVDSISQALGHDISFYDPGVIAEGLKDLLGRLW
jgi:predicted phage terminase large subunit-like protein